MSEASGAVPRVYLSPARIPQRYFLNIWIIATGMPEEQFIEVQAGYGAGHEA